MLSAGYEFVFIANFDFYFTICSLFPFGRNLKMMIGNFYLLNNQVALFILSISILYSVIGQDFSIQAVFGLQKFYLIIFNHIKISFFVQVKIGNEIIDHKSLCKSDCRSRKQEQYEYEFFHLNFTLFSGL